ncbi:MAG: hypothetical protein RR686_19005 [Morganella sp. (in: enterobacteria)]|uniref:Uncharacterized protein n=1 Tax=Morganella psychrotolerans TaxID=368603 RepID=A0A1B8HD08_9GAMM|nr:hypothetical protein [Morganella psychrotolerans]OBU06969.1 hypothetical protein AYY18_19680 [Morganella psychrotolerans]
MELSKNINIRCSGAALETFFIQRMFEIGNDGFAKEIGIHPSTASRDKNRIFRLACDLITHFGLPEDSVVVADKPPRLVVEGADAEWLMQMLEMKGKVKRKAPAVTEAQMDLTI